MRHIGITIATLLLPGSLVAPPAVAQSRTGDRVVLSRPGGGRVAVRGRILDYTGQTLTIERTVGRGRSTYPAEQVVEVQTPQTASHTSGLEMFTAGRIGTAITAFERALEAESRVWVRREILAMLVRCHLRQGDYRRAVSRFVVMTQSDPTTRHFGLIPLIWSASSADAQLRADALRRLTSPGQVGRLWGASVLLLIAEQTDAAQAVLKRLSVSADRRIRDLARAQQWRLRLRAGNIAGEELALWRNHIESMPQSLRGGPYFLLGTARFRRQEFDRAAIAFLWLPLVYDHDHHLAARACLDAGDSLLRLGQRPEAIAQYTEVIIRFRDTPFAQDAAAALKTPPTTPSDK